MTRAVPTAGTGDDRASPLDLVAIGALLMALPGLWADRDQAVSAPPPPMAADHPPGPNGTFGPLDIPSRSETMLCRLGGHVRLKFGEP